MTALPFPDRPVTGWDIMTEVSAMRLDVGRVLTKVEVMAAQQALQTAQLTDIETRLRTVTAAVPEGLAARLTVVERWQWRTSGAMAAVSIICGLLGGYISHILTAGH